MRTEYKVRIVPFVCLAAVLALVLPYAFRLHSSDKLRPSVNLSGTYSLVFDDEFQDLKLDGSKWGTCYEWFSTKHAGCSNYGNDESEWYRPGNVAVANGSLELKSVKQDTEGVNKSGASHIYPYASGMVSTGRSRHNAAPKWDGSYGYYEARMKVPSGQGVWPAFWLLPTDHQWPPEIDVMELLGDKPNQILNTYFWKGNGGVTAKDSSIAAGSADYAQGWHTYAVDWKKGSIDWYIDGNKVKSVRSSNVPSKKMQIILNLAIGGRLPGYPDASTGKKLVMSVDYVRVFQPDK